MRGDPSLVRGDGRIRGQAAQEGRASERVSVSGVPSADWSLRDGGGSAYDVQSGSLVLDTGEARDLPVSTR